MASTPLASDVLIVGAGLTALMLTTVLAILGIEHIPIYGKSGLTNEPRVLGFQARTLKIYE